MTIFDSVRQLLSQGDTAQALRLLITHLEKEKSSPEALRILRVVEANYNSARKKELKGILDFSEAQQAYNKTNDAIVSITDDLMAGRKPELEVERDEKQSNRVFWLIGGGILLLLGLIAGILLTGQGGRKEKEANECPKFDQTALPILLIPFQNLGAASSNPALALQTRIRDLTVRNNLSSDVQILSGNRFENTTPGMNEAVMAGQKCGAKMVVWGQYEKVDAGIALDVRYLFTEKPNIPAGAISETLRNLSELKTDEMKFSSLEEAIFSLCGRIAAHEGRIELAEKWLNKLKSPSPVDLKLKDALQKK
jgi:Effector-associated domain 11